MQIVAFPFFWQGAASPVEDVLDLVVAAALTALLGWHWSYLPSFLTKLTPALDLVPTWTGAVYLATRGKAFPRAQAATHPAHAAASASPSAAEIAGAEPARPRLAGATAAAAAEASREQTEKGPAAALAAAPPGPEHR